MPSTEKKLPLPSYVTKVSNLLGLPQVGFNLQFADNFPGYEYYPEDGKDHNTYVKQVERYLREEFSQLKPIFDAAPFLIDEYAEAILSQIAVIKIITDTYLDDVNKEEPSETLHAQQNLANYLIGLFDSEHFKHFLLYFAAKTAAPYHPFFSSVPLEYYSIGNQIENDRYYQEDSTSLNDESIESAKQYFRARIIESHQMGIIESLMKKLSNYSLGQLSKLVIRGGEEIFQEITNQT